MKRCRTDLEQQPDRKQCDARQDEATVGRGSRQRIGDPAQRDRASEAIEQRRAVEEESGGEGTENEVLQCCLLREQATSTREADHDVERQRENLERHEHRQQVGGRREEQHAANAEHEQRPHLGLQPPESREGLLVLGTGKGRRAGGEGVTGRVDVALSHHQCSDSCEHEDGPLHEQRGPIDRDRAQRHDLLGATGSDNRHERRNEGSERDDELDVSSISLWSERLD